MNILNLKSQIKQPAQVQTSQFDLSAAEIEVILRLLQGTNFPVRDIETLYVAIVKLQEQFKSKINANKSES